MFSTMKKTPALGVAMAFCALTAALPTHAADWSRPYAGLSLGASAGVGELSGGGREATLETSGTSVGAFAGVTLSEVGDADGQGWILGVEASATRLDLQASRWDPALGATLQLDADWMASAALQLGYGCDRVRLFGEIGVAVSDIGVAGAGGATDTPRIGALLGVGVDYALTEQWTARLSGDIAMFGEEDARFGGSQRDLGLGVATLDIGLARRF